MNFINSLNDKYFTLNGVQYFRNYVSAVHGDKIELYNCYERKDVLIPLTGFANFMVNGSVFISANELQAELLDVTYSRLTIGDGSSIDQNNETRVISAGTLLVPESGYLPLPLTTMIVNKLNETPIVITAKQTPVVVTVKLQSVPGTVKYTSKLLKYLFKPGKGNWGIDGTPIIPSHLELISNENYVVQDLLSEPNAVIENLGSISDGDFVTVANERLWDFADSDAPTEVGIKTYYFSYETEGVLYFAQFIGTPGIYGDMASKKFNLEDFTSSTDTRVTEVPNLEQVLAEGGNTNISQLTNNGDGTSPYTTEANLNGLNISVNQAAAEMYFKNSEGEILSTVSLGFLNNEGTTFYYNAASQQLQLKNDSGEILSEIPVNAFVSNLMQSVEFNGALPSKLEFKDATGNVVDSVEITITNITGLQTALNSKAPLVSPSFSGIPNAPTATTGTNTTQIATTAFVTSALVAKLDRPTNLIPTGANYVNGANQWVLFATSVNSSTIDTINVGTTTPIAIGITYATAINSLQNQINLKAPLLSPSFSGTPIAPTAIAGTNTTQVATTAFVTGAVATANANVIKQGGNSFGTDVTIGTNDDNSLLLEANGISRFSISANGELGLSGVKNTISGVTTFYNNILIQPGLGNVIGGVGGGSIAFGNNTNSSVYFKSLNPTNGFTFETVSTITGLDIVTWYLGASNPVAGIRKDGRTYGLSGTLSNDYYTVGQATTALAGKADVFSLKNIGGQSIFGTGNLTEVQNSLVSSTTLAPSVTAVNTALATKADENNAVHISGAAETITSAKTFTQPVSYTNTNFDSSLSDFLTIKNKITTATGWARGIKVTNNTDVNLAEFGVYGINQSLNYAYIGIGANPATSSPIFRVTSTGIGIGLSGTNLPATGMALDVNGTTRINTTAGTQGLIVTRGGNEGLEITPTTAGNGTITVANYDRTGLAYKPLVLAGSKIITNQGNVILETGNLNPTDTGEKLQVNGTSYFDGNSGFGIHTPLAPLHSYNKTSGAVGYAGVFSSLRGGVGIFSSSATATDYLLAVGTATNPSAGSGVTQRFNILANGNVIINNATDTNEKFQVTGDGKFTTNLKTPRLEFPFDSAQTTSRTWAQRNDYSVKGDFVIGTFTDQTNTSFLPKIYIKPTGEVGINSSNPTKTHYVAGTGEYTGQLTIPDGTGAKSAVTLDQLNAKVQNSLTPTSNTIAPSVGAVNTAIANYFDSMFVIDRTYTGSNWFTSLDTRYPNAKKNFRVIAITPTGSAHSECIRTVEGAPGLGKWLIIGGGEITANP